MLFICRVFARHAYFPLLRSYPFSTFLHPSLHYLKAFNHFSFYMLFICRVFARHAYFPILRSYPFSTFLQPSLHHLKAFIHLSFYMLFICRVFARHAYFPILEIISVFNFSSTLLCIILRHLIISASICFSTAGSLHGTLICSLLRSYPFSTFLRPSLHYLKACNHRSFNTFFNCRVFARHAYFPLLGSYPSSTFLHPFLPYLKAFNHLSFYTFFNCMVFARHAFFSSGIISVFNFSSPFCALS